MSSASIGVSTMRSGDEEVGAFGRPNMIPLPGLGRHRLHDRFCGRLGEVLGVNWIEVDGLCLGV